MRLDGHDADELPGLPHRVLVRHRVPASRLEGRKNDGVSVCRGLGEDGEKTRADGLDLPTTTMDGEGVTMGRNFDLSKQGGHEGKISCHEGPRASRQLFPNAPWRRSAARRTQRGALRVGRASAACSRSTALAHRGRELGSSPVTQVGPRRRSPAASCGPVERRIHRASFRGKTSWRQQRRARGSI